MKTSNLVEQLFPGLNGIKNQQNKSLLEYTQQVVVPAGKTIFKPGDNCTNYILVLSGSVKVLSRSENGKEIVLYHITTGNSCILTTSCLICEEHYPAEAITETDVIALMLPAKIFNDFMGTSQAFRELIFKSYNQRFINLIELIKKISFTRLDIRIAEHLLKHADINTPLITTHQQLANELGSAREVISRQLKELEKKKWIKTRRGAIEIINHDALFELSQNNS